MSASLMSSRSVEAVAEGFLSAVAMRLVLRGRVVSPGARPLMA